MKRSEYEALAAPFRERLLAGDWPDNTADWLSVQGISTCTTPPCEVFDQPFPVTLHENADGIYRVQCGRCGTSIVPVLNLEDD
ncbi:hypothetical protein [Streptomyces sp. NPDC048825]|uniref:hypothetical protein n=1 Tax=Streptomyces sp. NPDC048825 TaxID=3365592 RepID=UPI00372489A0